MLANDLSRPEDARPATVSAIGVHAKDEAPRSGIDPAGAGVMVCGTSGSGKSTLTTSILERLADAGYQSLVIDPEGDYTNLEFAHHVGNPEAGAARRGRDRCPSRPEAIAWS